MACLHKASAVRSCGSKRKLEDDGSESEEWQDWSVKLHARNLIPGTLAKKNITKAMSAGAKGPKLRGQKGKKNAARTLRRAYPKTNWPSLYAAQIPMRDPKTNQMKLQWHFFQLPHEWMSSFVAQPEALQSCLPKANSKLQKVRQKICSILELPVQGTFVFGFHGDGVPVQGTIRKQSLDFLTVNLPAANKNDFRVPFTVIQGKYHWEYDTKEAILKVLIWSMDCLKKGVFPTCRHDGSAWLPSDRHRRKLQGNMPARGILAEIRGDWDWLNSWLNVPAWNSGSGMCWLCSAKRTDFKQFTPNQRSACLPKTVFVNRVLDMGKRLCPIWELPEMYPADLILPDWLHAVDLGIGADIAGQLLVELADCYPGRSFKARVAELWKDIQVLYKDQDVEYKLQNLCPEMLNKGKKTHGPATLKSSAACVRHLIPILPILTAKHFCMGSMHQVACDNLAKFLAKAYLCMESNDLQELPKYGGKVASQYMALEQEALRHDPDSSAWHIMPKLHLFQHLCECGCGPKDFWCYQDETAGGVLAQLFTRRGGWENPGTNCRRTLERWQQVTAFPVVAL
jgi:hypothetical protein